MRIQNSLLMLSLSLAICGGNAFAIDNDPAKEYPLTEKHGPWMIMVGTFRDVQEQKLKKDGLTAAEAASRLVHELRDKGIPAYVFSQNPKKEMVDTYDRLGNKDKRVYKSQLDMVCVLAGNYSKVEDPVAQKTLAYVKKLRPKFMSDPKSGAVVRFGQGDPKGPFSGAFLTINPCLDPANVVRQKADKETNYLNSGIDYPVVNIKGKYTLKIATFTGKSVVPMGNSRFRGQEASFDKSIFEKGPYNLARAGEDATQLTYALRQSSRSNRGLNSGQGRDRFEAYVYHDKFQSFVTIGGFNSPDDPEIRRLTEIFKAKYKSDGPEDSGEYSLVGESLSLYGNDPNSPPIQTWAFDPAPELIEVPRIK